MRDSLQEAIDALVELGERVISNERRPSADAICMALTHIVTLLKAYQTASAVSPLREPYVMDSPTIDKIEAAINAGHRISIETDGRVLVTSPDGVLAEAPVETVQPTVAGDVVDEPIPVDLPPDEPVLSSAGVLRSDIGGPADVPTIEEGTAAGSGDASGGRPPDADPSR